MLVERPAGPLRRPHRLAAPWTSAVTTGPLAEPRCRRRRVGLVDGEVAARRARRRAGRRRRRRPLRKLTLLRPDAPPRVLVAGLGERPRLDAERLRVVAARAAKRAARARRGARSPGSFPSGPGRRRRRGRGAGRGHVLAAYRFDRFRRRDDDDRADRASARLTLLVARRASASRPRRPRARLGRGEAANRARDLQNLPANVLTPQALAERARGDRRRARRGRRSRSSTARRSPRPGMGGLVAVSQGTAAEPRLIALRYAGGGSGPRSGWSARRSRSTAAASRSSPRRACTR